MSSGRQSSSKEIASVNQSKRLAVIATALYILSFCGLETEFAAATVAFIGALIALREN